MRRKAFSTPYKNVWTRVAALCHKWLQSMIINLNAWHGPTDAQEDIPDDFKEGIRDIAAGKIVDLDEVLAKTPSTDAV